MGVEPTYQGLHACALPLDDAGWSPGRCLAMIAGRLELPTVRFAAWCSFQLSYAIVMVVEGLEPSVTSI